MDYIQSSTEAISSPSPIQGLKKNANKNTNKNINKNANKNANKTDTKTQIAKPTNTPKQSTQHESTQEKSKKTNDRHMPKPREMVADLCSLTEDYELALGEANGEKVVFIRLPVLEPHGGAPIENSTSQPWTPIYDLDCEQHLQRISARQFDRGATKEVTAEVIRHLEGRGLDLFPQPMFRRYGFHEGKIYVDLGCKRGLAVVIDPLLPEGYQVTTDPPVVFRRTRDFGELPVPALGGNRTLLTKYFPNLSNEGKDALFGLLMSCFVPNEGFPTMILSGREGSGKSVAEDLIRLMIDPLKSGGGRTTLPLKVEDLMTVVSSGFLATFDNASKLGQEISDALCQVSTGGSLQTRKLYTQGEVYSNHVRNPVLLSSVALPHDKPDLLSRSVILEFQSLKGAVRPECDVKASFQKDLPAILGFLYPAIAKGLQDASGTRVTPSSRLIASEQFVTAAEILLGCQPGAIVSAWNLARATASAEMKGADPVVTVLQEKLKNIGQSISGTSTDLLNELIQFKTEDNGKVLLPPDFPKTAQAFGIHLAKKISLLEAEGIEVSKTVHTNSGSLRTITRVSAPPAPAWQVQIDRPIRKSTLPVAPSVSSRIPPAIPLPVATFGTAA